MKPIFAHLISIGDEVLLGDTLDTNANYIAKALAKINVQVKEISVIADDEQVIKSKIIQASKESQIIITTGGLGPTRDDKTKHVIASLLGDSLTMNPTALKWVEEYYENILGRTLNTLTRNQALLPPSSIPLRNNTGTACGIWSEYKGCFIINLPGIPNEMEHLMQTQVLPKIKETFQCSYKVYKYIKVLGIPESDLALKLNPIEAHFPSHIHLAYLPKNKKIKLRLSAQGENKELLEQELSDYADKIKHTIPNNIYAENEDDTLEKIKLFCNEKKITIGTAESFTAGLLASKLTSIPGSSQFFLGGIIAYSPQAKSAILKVSSALITEKGTVNKVVSEAMAKGALATLECDVAISTTGVAGPNKDEFDNEVGLAYITISSKNKTETHQFFYPNLSRENFTEKLSDIALDYLMLFLKNF